MIRGILTTIASGLTGALLAQITFVETYGGPLSDMARGVTETTSGYVLAGSSMNGSNGGYDLVITRTDLQGNVQSTSTVGNVNCDQGFSTVATGDWVYIAGSSIPEGRSDHDGTFVLLNDNDIVLWQQSFGTDQSDEIFQDVVLTGLGDLVVCGLTNGTANGDNDILLVKYDGMGNQLWAQSYDMPLDQEAWSVLDTPNGLYVAGRSMSNGQEADLIYMLVDGSNGALQWSYVVGDSMTDIGRDIDYTFYNDIILCGHTNSYGAVDFQGNVNDHVWVVRTELNGDTIWTRTIGDTLTHRRAFAVTPDPSGFVVCGVYREEHTQAWQAYWLKLDQSGNLVWEHLFDNSQRDELQDISRASDGGYIMCGWTFGPDSYDMLLIKTDQNGNPD